MSPAAPAAGSGAAGGSRGTAPVERVTVIENRRRIQRIARVSMLAATALVLSYIETMLPMPVAVPGIKLGLANIAVIVALFTLDIRSAAGVALVKVLASGLLFGSPAMLIYSAGGMACAFAGMVLLSLMPGVGLLPVSMLSAVLHNAGQLAVAAWILGTPAVFINLPMLAVAACVTGGITGAAATTALDSLSAPDNTASEDNGAPARPLVDCHELIFEPGTITAFIGPNGSGKSTCAFELAGLIDMFDGEGRDRSAELLPAIMPNGVGLAFQDPDNQIVAPCVRDDVAFGPENRGTDVEGMREIIDTALVTVSLSDKSLSPVSTLSGGQKQRAAIAGLLALAPGLLIFDEPTAMLDPEARARFMQTVRDLCAQGAAVALATQHMDEAQVADRLAVFSEGRIAWYGRTEDFAAWEQVFA